MSKGLKYYLNWLFLILCPICWLHLIMRLVDVCPYCNKINTDLIFCRCEEANYEK